MAATYKQLGQLRPANTTAATIATLAASTQWVNVAVKVCNLTGSAATYRIFHDDNGAVYDETSALAYDIAIAANSTADFAINVCGSTATGTIGVRTGTASALNFTAYGLEKT